MGHFPIARRRRLPEAPFSGMYPLTRQGASRLPAGRPRKLPFMNGDPNLVEGTTRAALPRDARRDAWLEQRLTYLAGERARLKGGVPLRRFLRGVMSVLR